jgi:hypothetical protein
MKKIVCLIAGLMFVFTVDVFAAYTFVATRQDASNGWIQLDIVVTADSTHSATTYKLPYSLGGRYLYSIETYYGATGPTDNTDITLLQHTSSGKDILNGAGTDKIDNAGNNFFQPRIGTDAAGAAVYGPIPVYGNLYLVISNQAVNSAVFTIRLNFIN